MTYFVYLLLDSKSMIGYVGKSVHPDQRMKEHWNGRFKEGTNKSNWLQTLRTPPQLIVLQKCKEVTWEKWERIWIRDLKRGGLRLVNANNGGGGVIAHTVETRKSISRNISKLLIGKRHSKETRKRIGLANKGKVRSEQFKKAVGTFHRGRTRPEETGLKISAARKGHKVSKETRCKISMALKGRPKSEQAKLKLKSYYVTHPSTFRGCRHSEESKRKMSLAAKGRIPWNKGRKLVVRSSV